MKIGITGHQTRPGIRWSWVAETIRNELVPVTVGTHALSSMATGADQVFAEVALTLGIPVTAVVPFDGYERFFDVTALYNYRRLLAQTQVVHLHWTGDPEHGFFEAGKYIVDASDLLFAVWDGEKAESHGGTADVVAYAQRKLKDIVHINPCVETVARI